MKVNAFITHKKAEHFADCQDRFSVNADTKSIAVSDGMGSTWQQKIWAQLLVSRFTKDTKWSPKSKDSIKELCNQWTSSVNTFIENLKKKNAPQNIIFRNERNLADGKSAGATFVGVRFLDDKWECIVLGDSCLIVWDGSKAKFCSSQDVEQFDSFPDYFDSSYCKDGKGQPKTFVEVMSDSTALLVVSDPFSNFLIEKNKEAKLTEYIPKLLDLSSHEDFESIVSDWRDEGMPNDDTTLVVIKPSNSRQLEEGHIDNLEALITQEEILTKRTKEKSEKKEDEIIEENQTERKEAITVSQTNPQIEKVPTAQVEREVVDSVQTEIPIEEILQRISASYKSKISECNSAQHESGDFLKCFFKIRKNDRKKEDLKEFIEKSTDFVVDSAREVLQGLIIYSRK